MFACPGEERTEERKDFQKAGKCWDLEPGWGGELTGAVRYWLSQAQVRGGASGVGCLHSLRCRDHSFIHSFILSFMHSLKELH